MAGQRKHQTPERDTGGGDDRHVDREKEEGYNGASQQRHTDIRDLSTLLTVAPMIVGKEEDVKKLLNLQNGRIRQGEEGQAGTPLNQEEYLNLQNLYHSLKKILEENDGVDNTTTAVSNNGKEEPGEEEDKGVLPLHHCLTGGAFTAAASAAVGGRKGGGGGEKEEASSAASSSPKKASDIEKPLLINMEMKRQKEKVGDVGSSNLRYHHTCASSRPSSNGTPKYHQSHPSLRETMTSSSNVVATVASSSLLVDHQQARSFVLHSPDLLHMILTYLLNGYKAEDARLQLNTLSLVCHRFKEVCTRDGFWKPVALGLLPVLGAPCMEEPATAAEREDTDNYEAAIVTGGGGGSNGNVDQQQHLMARKKSYAGFPKAYTRKRSMVVDKDYRAYLLHYGRCLLHRRAWMGEALEHRYSLGFEVWDAKDGLRMLSATGPIRVQIDQAGGFTSLRIGGAARREIRGPPFSASSRHVNFVSMEDFFARQHLKEFPCMLSVRVTVTDERTGKMALLWYTIKDSAYLCEPPLTYWAPYLAPGSISCFLDHWSPLMCANYDQESMTVTVGFHIEPEPGQEMVPENERLYRLAGGDVGRYKDHQSYMSITFMTLNTNAIHQFFRALLQDEC